jgi:predicted dehydrogenase
VTIAESRAVADTVRRFARVYQGGMQRRNVGNFVYAAELARSGRLGRLKALHAEKAGAQSGVHFTVLPPEPEPAREAFDWDLYLGPAAWRPYNAQYHNRGYWASHGDFSGGPITEWGSHTVDLCQWANDADATMPIQYEVINDKGDVRGRYANGANLIIRSGLRFGSCPVRFEGEEGWVETGDSGRIEHRSPTRVAAPRPPVPRRLSGRRPRARIPGLRAQPPSTQRQRRRGPPLDQRLSRGQHRRPPGPVSHLGPGHRGVRRRRRGQPLALDGHAATVAPVVCALPVAKESVRCSVPYA